MTTDTGKPPVDLARLERTTAGDVEVERELLRIFVEQTDEKMKTLDRSLTAADYEQIGEEAHSLKGASANVGADHLRELASSLEAGMKNGEHDRAHELVEEVRKEYVRVRAFIDGRSAGGDAP